MIAAWMLIVLVAGSALAALALAAGWMLDARRRPGRFAWAAAMLGTLALAIVVPLRRAPAPAPMVPMPATVADAPTMAVAAPGRLVQVRDAVRASATALVTRAAGAPAPVQWSLGALWAAMSLAVLLVLAITVLRMRRARAHWPVRTVDGVTVQVRPQGAPMVVGLRRAMPVVPAWVVALPEAARTIVLRHELEHVRARDGWLLALAAVPVVALAWHPAIWWMWHRLLLAVECDCDRRVLAHGVPARDYGELLLATAARLPSSRLLLPWPAMHGAPSFLERRIMTMTARRRPLPLLRASSLLAASTLLLLAACERAIPTSAEIERMDGRAAARAVPLIAGPQDSVQVYVDGKLVQSRDLDGISADSIASVNVTAVPGGRVKEVRVVTRSGRVGDSLSSRARREVVVVRGDSGAAEGMLFVPSDGMGTAGGVGAARGGLVMRADSIVLDGRSGAARTDTARVLRLDGRSVPFTGPDPLYVVDGVVATRNALASLQPGDIVSVTVLKGPSATALYGQAGANGAVQITTRNAPRLEAPLQRKPE